LSGELLKIAMLSVHSCPVGNLGAKDTGGMSVYIRELARELGGKGHLVDVYTRVHDQNDPQVVDLGHNARLIHLRVGDDTRIEKLALYTHLPDFACSLENYCQQNNQRYDIIFSHYWLSALVGEYLKNWWHIPHLTMFHTLGAVKNTFNIGSEETELRIETEKSLARNCDRIIAATPVEKEYLTHLYTATPERIEVIPCGVNLQLFYPRGKRISRQRLGLTDDKVLLFVGRIDPLKGINQLIKALPLLQNGQKRRLLIVGGDEDSRAEIATLQGLTQELKVQDSVSFLGTIKHEQLPYYYSAADLCVMPSYYESFGMVALEALACGTPVVATDVGALKSIIRQGETGYVVTDNSPRQLAGQIELLLNHPITELKSVMAMRESVSQYGWANIAEAIVRECHRALAHAGAVIA